MLSIQQALLQAAEKLRSKSDTARLDAEILLAYVLGKPRVYLVAHANDLLLKTHAARFNNLINQRYQGIPVAHLTEHREFWSLPLKVTPDTLIPRPDTERLVELALELLKNKPKAKVLDLGTGTGAIALALAKERPDWTLYACEKQLKTLEVAKYNASQLSASNVQFIHSNWFESIPSITFDAIVSNPPYIAENDPHLSEGDVRYEPMEALTSGPEGLDDIKHIVAQSTHYLKPGGLLLIEHGYNQRQEVLKLLAEAGYQNIQCWRDLQGQYRVSGGFTQA